MATTKTNNTTNVPLLAFLMLIVGAAGMYIALPFISSGVELSPEYATVQRINGLYVFVESNPATDYNTIRTIEGDDFIEVFNDLGIGKQKAGQVIQNIFNASQDNLNFHRKLELMADKAKEENPDAEGIIFHGKMNRCEVIKFN